MHSFATLTQEQTLEVTAPFGSQPKKKILNAARDIDVANLRSRACKLAKLAEKSNHHTHFFSTGCKPVSFMTNTRSANRSASAWL